jgi:hypothetical protein
MTDPTSEKLRVEEIVRRLSATQRKAVCGLADHFGRYSDDWLASTEVHVHAGVATQRALTRQGLLRGFFADGSASGPRDRMRFELTPLGRSVAHHLKGIQE